MVKKLKDVNKDGKINFKDTWLGERLTTKGKLKGPNLAESMKGARRESAADTSTMSSPKPKAKPTVKPAAKSATIDAGSRVGAKDRPVKTVAELRAAKKKSGGMGGSAGAGTSASADVKITKKVTSTEKKPNDPKVERPISPTRDKSATGRYSKYEAARLGNITEAQWDKMTRAQREAKGLPVSWMDYVRSGGDAVVKSPKSNPTAQAGKVRTGNYSKGGMTKGKK